MNDINKIRLSAFLTVHCVNYRQKFMKHSIQAEDVKPAIQYKMQSKYYAKVYKHEISINYMASLFTRYAKAY